MSAVFLLSNLSKSFKVFDVLLLLLLLELSILSRTHLHITCYHV